MKNYPLKQTLKAVLFFLIVALTMIASSAQQPENSATSATPSVEKPSSKSSTIQGVDSWKWPGSDERKPEIFYGGIPLSEIVKDLRHAFKYQFDMLLPRNLAIPNLGVDVQAVPVNLYLRNVTAAEIFNAMNLYFEIQKLPLRWKLTLNGQRATAALEVLEETKRLGTPASEKPQTMERSVIYVGDLLGEPGTGGMAMDKLAETLLDMYQIAFQHPLNNRQLLRCHYGAELIIVTGTAEEFGFIRSAVEALKQKVVNDRLRKSGQTATQSNPASEKKSP